MPYQGYRCALNATQSHLIRRQIMQILSRPHEDRQALVSMAGRAFVPTTGALTFDSPIQPLGEVELVVLSRSMTTGKDGGAKEILFLRGYTARINSRGAVTQWGPATSRFAYDFARRTRPEAWGPVAPLGKTALIRVALDLDRECERQVNRIRPLSSSPILPPTLLGLPPDAPLDPQPTPTVLAHARRYGITWDDAWHDLWHRWRVPDEINDTGYELVDTRLRSSMLPCPDWAGSLAEFHDLRHFINRAVYNPARDGVLSPELDGDAIAEAMRRRLPPDLAEACRDAELIDAAEDLRAPLIMNGLSKLQVWQPPSEITAPDSFRLSCPGHEADLWNVKPHWMYSIHGLARHDDIEVNSVSAELAGCP